jgi:hypothetical protein
LQKNKLFLHFDGAIIDDGVVEFDKGIPIPAPQTAQMGGTGQIAGRTQATPATIG